MRYAGIDKCDLCNGLNIGTSLYVQGCNQHCPNCFNPETWDFTGGKEWNEETKNQFFTLLDRPYIKRVTILGGEPLAAENICDVYSVVLSIRKKYPDKKIWLYTGFELSISDFKNIDIVKDNFKLRNLIIKNCDVIVDGAYIDELRDLTLPFRGSSNQRIIDVKKTLESDRIILYDVTN